MARPAAIIQRWLPSQPHVLLWSAYPVLGLLAANLELTLPESALRPLLVSLVGGLLLTALLRLFLRDASKAALGATLLIGLFYLYGHVFALIETQPVGRHRYVLGVWALLAAASLFAIIKRGGRANRWHTFLNLTGALLVGWSLAQITWFEARGWLLQQRAQTQTAVTSDGLRLPSEPAPDVYYIVLDGYARQDVLAREYDYNNSQFLNRLRELGFFVADCAQSNYAWTMLSLSSTLQMDYVDAFAPDLLNSDAHPDYLQFHDFIAHSPVRRNLEALGYRMVAFETGWPFTEVNDADLFIEKSKNHMARYLGSGGLNPFELMLLRTSLLRPALEMNAARQARRLPVAVGSLEQQHYERLVFVMSQAEQLSAVPGRKFVFLHLVAPHAPYIFKADGTFSDVGAEEVGYPEEIRYLNRWFLEFAQKLIAQSKTPPVIIVQGDHGWRKGERTAIFSAYHLPVNADGLYNSITPVNSFRVMFNQVFGGNYPLLEDRSYGSPEDKQLMLQPVPASCPNQK